MGEIKIKKLILIVEDYFINQEMLQDMLETLGHEVDTAEDGEEAVEKYKKNTYDLILMDIQMPKKDGYQAAKEIRSLEKGQKPTFILALTANALSSDREKCLAAGMDDYISKPVDKKQLERKLNEIFNKQVE